jgi:hypothetical protein
MTGPGVHTNAAIKIGFSGSYALPFGPYNKITYFNSSGHRLFGIFFVVRWQTTCTHIAIPNGFDPFQVVPGYDVVESSEIKT